MLEAVRNWTAGTRISPVFALSHDLLATELGVDDSDKVRCLLFLGPLPPFDVLALVPRLQLPPRLWLTLGAYNIIVDTCNQGDIQLLVDWAQAHQHRWECWTVENDTLLECRYWAPLPKDLKWRQALSSLILQTHSTELKDAAEEYVALIAATLSRAEIVCPALVEHLLRIHGQVVSRISPDREIENPRGLTALLVDLNAGLSRFSSQTFSGASPILETECHFWTHSLLGTGTANLAIHNLATHVESTLGDARIQERIQGFTTILEAPRFEGVYSYNEPIWKQEWIEKVPVAQNPQTLQPLVSYLSGRDGFKTTESTISVPLNIITSCTSLRWHLLTITHEFTHTIMKGVLAAVLPEFGTDEYGNVLQVWNQRRPPANLLESVRHYLIAALNIIEQNEGANPLGHPANEDAIHRLIARRKEEVEEIMVHAFDFVYYYGNDTDRYIRSIWHSWDSIPSLQSRIPGYVLRTLTSVSLKYLERPDRAITIYQEVRQALESTLAQADGTTYIREALDHLEREWQPTLRMRLAGREPLVAFVKAFLQSSKLLQKVRGGVTESRSGIPTPEPGVLSSNNLANPLRFAADHTDFGGTRTEAAWLLTTLAYNWRLV